MAAEMMCTVLIVTYKQEKYIGRAIDSVLSQNTKYAYKIHIFDDASPDGSAKIIKEYEKRYPEKIKAYIAEENMGAQNNFWRSLASVDTKYFLILEGDDYWCDKRKLELQINAMEKHPECSFCGHDTYLSSLEDSSREYKEGSLCCTQKFLKNKSIFTYKDFEHVNDGGYIPYVSARLIRSSAVDLSKIRYKESILFDFTQFYYLLLQGKYYYIDLPMTVYQRTGEGVCSGISPMQFLNTFWNNAIEFNLQTNNVIADKIFTDCILQANFRMKLYKERYIKKARFDKKGNPKPALQDKENKEGILVKEESFSPDLYYFMCNGGLGFTTFLCAAKESLEKKLGADIVFIVQDSHAFIMDIFGIKNYIEADFTDLDVERISDENPNMKKGKIFVTHPFAHKEATQFYLPILGLYSSKRYKDWIFEFFGLDGKTDLQYVHSLPNLNKESIEKVHKLGNLEKVVLFLPMGYTMQNVSEKYWEEEAAKLKKEGYEVYSAPEDKRQTIRGSRYADLTAEEIVYVGMLCHKVYSLRNGFCDLLQERGKDLHVVYPSHAAHYIYSFNQPGMKASVNEKIVLESAKLQFNKKDIRPKAMLFGKIALSDGVYGFYYRHKHFFAPAKSLIKKLIKWK